MRGVPLAEGLATLRQCLPPQAILVGQNIGKDIEWLGLKDGTDFQVRSHMQRPLACMAVFSPAQYWELRYY